MYNAYVCVADEKTIGTIGGTFETGAWRTRDINTEQSDAESICSIASNQITLAAGTYRCLITCPAFGVNGHQAILYNVSDSAVLLQGSSCRAIPDQATTHSIIQGRFTLATEKTLEVRHRCETTRVSIGFGVNASFTEEIYTVAEFWREE